MTAYETQTLITYTMKPSSSNGYPSRVTQLKPLTQTQTQPLHGFNGHSNPPRYTKHIIFHEYEHTNIIFSDPEIIP